MISRKTIATHGQLPDLILERNNYNESTSIVDNYPHRRTYPKSTYAIFRPSILICPLSFTTAHGNEMNGMTQGETKGLQKKWKTLCQGALARPYTC